MNGIENLETKNGCVLVHNEEHNIVVLLDCTTYAPLASLSKDTYGDIIRTSGASGSILFNHGEGWR